MVAFSLISVDQMNISDEEQTAHALIQVQLKHLHVIKPLLEGRVALVGGTCRPIHQLVSAQDWYKYCFRYCLHWLTCLSISRLFL